MADECMGNEEVEDELTCVSSILLDTITVHRDQEKQEIRVDLQLWPLTASDEDLSYVGLLLALTLGPGYPNEPPGIAVKCPRGLAESDVNQMVREMNRKCEDLAGCPVIFELVDYVREFLTERNVPDGPCPVCLTSMAQPAGQDFCKTPCFHYFHSFCLARHFRILQADEESAGKPPLCPVCREDISGMDVDKLLAATELPDAADEAAAADGGGDGSAALKDWKRKQKKMKAVYQRQLKAGGIIDLDQEAKRCLVITTATSAADEASTSAAAAVGSEQLSAVNEPAAPPPPPAAAASVKATSQKASKDEDAGNRQRYKRQPKSKYGHHRNIKARNS